MITRFDHAVIAARDLADARALFAEQLGFEVYPGGRHTGLGTENAIVRFGLDYLEVLGVYSRDEVIAAGVKRVSLLHYLEENVGGLLGYCLATDDIEGLAARFQERGLDALGPYAMQRRRPDGLVLEWRLLVPGGTAWRRSWPFFIQWGMSDEERLQHETPGSHPVGAVGVGGVAVVVAELDAAIYLYQDQLGLELVEQGSEPAIGANRARFRVGDSTIDLFAPVADGEIASALDANGEGLYEVTLAVSNLVETRTALEEVGIRLTSHPVEESMQVIPAEDVLGVRFALTENRNMEGA